MSYYVSTIHNLPVNNMRFFVHVFDTTNGTHTRWIMDNLQELGQVFGADAGLVTGPQELTKELRQFLSDNTTGNFDLIGAILAHSTCLIISEGHLASTTKNIYLLPLSPAEESAGNHAFIDVLLRMLSQAMQTGKLDELFSDLGAIPIGLNAVSGGFFVCSLRNLNQILELKPNLMGIGMNINALIEKLLPPAERSV